MQTWQKYAGAVGRHVNVYQGKSLRKKMKVLNRILFTLAFLTRSKYNFLPLVLTRKEGENT